MFRALRDPCDMSGIRVKERDSCDPSTVLEPVRSGFDCPGIHQLRTPPATICGVCFTVTFFSFNHILYNVVVLDTE